ncbi:MAG: YceI family protein [Xanthomonadaceae bacterium]|nr:YceI family protein [Xanthomonadaceae bacterium]
MRRTYRSLIALALAGSLFGSASALAAPENYRIDETHSFINFSISHLGFSYLKGRFNELSGSFVYDPDNPSSNSITVEVKTASIDSNHAERDKHLRGKDFFNVNKYPVATFKTTSFEPKGEDGILKGELTMLGVTKPIEVEVTFVGAGKDPWGGYRRGYVGKTTIKRSDWGMTYDLGPAAETVDLEFVIEGIRE